MKSNLKEVLSTKNEELKKSTKYLSNLEVKERVVFLSGNLLSEKFIPWYCKIYREIGEDRFTKVAHIAKEGMNPTTLFGWLLKNEAKRT